MNEKIQIISGNLNKFKNWVNTRIRIPLYNTLVGKEAGEVTTGNYNTFIGYQAGRSNTSANYNNFVGFNCGYNTITGHHNCFMGVECGFMNTAGHTNVFIGNQAGYHETGDEKLFIDFAARANEADARVKALIYGVFDGATANQRLSINAQLKIKEVAEYASDADAGTGGLTAGEIYRHADGSLYRKF